MQRHTDSLPSARDSSYCRSCSAVQSWSDQRARSVRDSSVRESPSRPSQSVSGTVDRQWCRGRQLFRIPAPTHAVSVRRRSVVRRRFAPRNTNPSLAQHNMLQRRAWPLCALRCRCMRRVADCRSECVGCGGAVCRAHLRYSNAVFHPPLIIALQFGLYAWIAPHPARGRRCNMLYCVAPSDAVATTYAPLCLALLCVPSGCLRLNIALISAIALATTSAAGMWLEVLPMAMKFVFWIDPDRGTYAIVAKERGRRRRLNVGRWVGRVRSQSGGAGAVLFRKVRGGRRLYVGALVADAT